MEHVLNHIRAGELEHAYVRLWVLSSRRNAAGRYLNAWESPPLADRLDDDVELARQAIEAGMIGAVPQVNPLAWITALDQLFEADRSNLCTFRAYLVDRQSYYLFMRKPTQRAAGVARQAGNRETYFQARHVVSAEQAEHIVVKPLRATGLAAERMRALARGAELRVWVGHFADGVTLVTQPVANQHFIATGLTDEEARWTSVLGQLNAAQTQHAQIVVFPELTITPTLRQRLAKHLRKQSQWHAWPALALVCAGSFHEKSDDHRRNRTTLFNAAGHPPCLRTTK